MIKSYDELFGTVFINREYGVEPSISPDVTVNGLIDCIHKVTIEKDVFTGHDVMLLTGAHDYAKFGLERKTSTAGGEIYIEEGVWIATRAIVLGGVRIGRHAVIGAGSVVTKSVPPYQLWAGNPAKFIKEIKH